MPNELRSDYVGKTLEQMHEHAEALIAPFAYRKPDTAIRTKGLVQLGDGEIIKGKVQVVKKNGGENNLHYHTSAETFWWVIKGRVRFYGPGDVLIADLGPNEGVITPRYSRYWFECASEEDLELLQIAASDAPGLKHGRTDAAARHSGFGQEITFDRVKDPTTNA